MKNRILRFVGALVLSLVILLTPFSVALAEETSQPGYSIGELLEQPEALITRGAFIMLVNNVLMIQDDFAEENFLDVPDDHPYAADILRAKVYGFVKGDGNGNVRPDAILSGAEAAVIVNNLLGFDGSLVEQTNLPVPSWSTPAVSVLSDLAMADSSLIVKKELTVGDSLSFLYAIIYATMVTDGPYALKQTRLQDDYYAYTNRQYIATAPVAPGNMYAASFNDTSAEVDAQLQEILSVILYDGDWEVGSDEWKIAELFNMYLDNEARTASLAQLKPYFDDVRAAGSISELLAVAKKHAKYFDLQPLYLMSVGSDAKVDATKWCTVLIPAPLDLGAREYYAEDESLALLQEVYKEYLASLLAYMGETEDLAARAEAIYAIEKERAFISLPSEAYTDPYLTYTDATWEDMLEMTSTTGTLLFMEDIYDIISEFPIYCPEPEYIKYVESLYTEDNLRVLKDLALFEILSSCASMLGDDLMALSSDLVTVMYGTSGQRADEFLRAQSFVTSTMWQTFSGLYAEAFASEEMKADVTDIVESIRAKLRERIMALDWMSDATKKAAVTKLDSISTFIAYPDEQREAAPFDVKAKEDGGTLIDLFFSMGDAEYDDIIKSIQKPYDYDLWDMVPTSMVNAFYNPGTNSIIIPAGILRGEFYNLDAPREQNLGGIGAVIAHEFTHAFDNYGAQFDIHGTLTNWWTEDDYVAFGELTDAMANAISSIAFYGGIYINGAMTTGEAIADLGALACVFDILDDSPDADLTAAMLSWSAVWASRIPPEIVMYFLYVDSHLPNKTRVNFILAQFEEFYTAYGITEGDGMFIPVDARLAIW